MLAAGSMLDLGAIELIEAAAAAGFDGIGLRLSGEHAVSDGVGDSLRTRSSRTRAARRRGPSHHGRLAAARSADRCRRGDRCRPSAHRVRSRRCERNGPPAGADRRALSFGGHRARARVHGVDDAERPAGAIAAATGAGCVVIVDALHHVRVGADADDLSAIVEAGVFGWLQLCDAPARGAGRPAPRGPSRPPASPAPARCRSPAWSPDCRRAPSSASRCRATPWPRRSGPHERAAILHDSARRAPRSRQQHRVATEVRPRGRRVHLRRIVGIRSDAVVEQDLHGLGHEAEDLARPAPRRDGRSARRRGPGRCRRASPTRTTARTAARCPACTRCGSKSSASAPNTVWSRLTLSRSITTLSPLAIERPDFSSMSSSAQRIPTGDDGWSRTVSCVQRWTNNRSVRTSSTSSGCDSSHVNTLCITRVNAVADVWAPASR